MEGHAGPLPGEEAHAHSAPYPAADSPESQQQPHVTSTEEAHADAHVSRLETRADGGEMPTPQSTREQDLELGAGQEQGVLNGAQSWCTLAAPIWSQDDEARRSDEQEHQAREDESCEESQDTVWCNDSRQTES